MDDPVTPAHTESESGAPRAPHAPQPSRSSSPRLIIGLVVAAIVVTIAVIVTGLVLASRISSETTAPDTGLLAVPAAPAPGADGRYCKQLLTQLPDRLADEPRRALSTASPGVAAWGDPAIIVRCGLPDPTELTCASPLMQFTGADGRSVAWLQLEDSSATTYLAADRPVRIAITLPPGTGTDPVQHLSDVIAKTLPRQPVCTGGTITATDNT